MKIWLACFGVLFALAELYQWVKHLMLPLPIYILGGAFLAITSNYSKLSLWNQEDSTDQPPAVIPSVKPPGLSAPTSAATAQPVSFTIRRLSDPSKRTEVR